MASPVIGSSVLANINGPAVAAPNAASANSSEELNDRFMTMLITQLKNQDPTNPMDNSDMTAQLAQINTVSGIEKLNASLSDITDQIDAGQTLRATALIGQGVMVPGNQILVGVQDETTGAVAATPMGVELAAPADSLNIQIKGANGQTLASFEEQGPFGAGVHSFTWDGKLEDGSYASSSSSYQVAVTALNGEETSQPQTLNYALVNGVIRNGDSPMLDLGYNQDPVALSDVRQIL